MALRPHTLDARLASLEEELAPLRAALGAGAVATAIERWRADAGALRFHLRDRSSGDRLPIVVILGGTGTGKSTLVNRLLGATVAATSFRRTYTAGAVAIVPEPGRLAAEWLGVEHRTVAEADLPARGEPDALIVATSSQPLAARVILVDTPDLDGDQPVHHVQADRAFRWADAVLFAVTPEKYQMTELLPYYRLARRYGIRSLFVMNKCEETAVLEDYGKQLAGREWADARVFAVARDDAAWSPPAGADLSDLREAIQGVPAATAKENESGLAARAIDLLGRLTDQVIAPLRDSRREADRLIASLHAMEAPEPGVDVNPITNQLQRRLQQRSVLYLMGPGRMMERVRQVPGLVVRLPRTLWDAVIRGKKVTLNEPPPAEAGEGKAPDFRAGLVDQFAVVQSRIDDALRSSPLVEKWMTERAADYRAAQLDPADAGKIADEELADLRNWLEKRWNATPRDTLLILKLLRHLPGGARLVNWFEAAPYLLAALLATHYAVFGHVELMVVGGFTLATWLSERLSNEVTNRVRATNRRIGERFTELAHAQIQRACEWLDRQAPATKSLRKLEQQAEELSEAMEEQGQGDGGA
jgi:hypothetical protein